MTKQTYTTRSAKTLSALIFATACGLTACAPEDSDTYQPPYDAGLTQDGSAAVVAPDSGTTPIVQPTPDAGAQVTFDAGTTPVVTVDAGPVVSPTGDAGPVVTPEGGTPDAGGTAAPRADQGMGDGKDVITIGDSWMNLDDSVGIEESLLKVSKRPYRTFGVPGTKLLDEVIPKQYTTAKMQGPVKTVIMTAGGNDVLQDLELGPFNILGTPGCQDGTFNAACKTRIDEVAARLGKLWAQMAQDGVQDVVIIAYSNKTLGGKYKSVSSYSNEKITPLCNSVPAPLRCSSFDTDMNAPDFKDRGDSIHPDNPTYDVIGTAVWKLMQDKGMRR